MTPLAVALCLALASVTLAVAAGTVIGTLGARLMRTPAAQRLGARTRASLLAQLRLAPLGLLLPVGLVVQVAFWRFEPAQAGERVGPLLVGFTVLGACGVLLAMGRLVRANRATGVVREQWRAAATPTAIPGWRGPAYRVDSGFPVVAVVGVWRPELFVATHVADACTHGEIAVVAAHEHAHVAARDNLMRAAFAATPFVGSAAELARAGLGRRGRGGRGPDRPQGRQRRHAGRSVGEGGPPGDAGRAAPGARQRAHRRRRPRGPPPAAARSAAADGPRRLVGRRGRDGWLVAASSPVLRQVYDAAEFVVAFGR